MCTLATVGKTISIGSLSLIRASGIPDSSEAAALAIVVGDEMSASVRLMSTLLLGIQPISAPEAFSRTFEITFSKSRRSRRIGENRIRAARISICEGG